MLRCGSLPLDDIRWGPLTSVDLFKVKVKCPSRPTCFWNNSNRTLSLCKLSRSFSKQNNDLQACVEVSPIGTYLHHFVKP